MLLRSGVSRALGWAGAIVFSLVFWILAGIGLVTVVEAWP